MKYNFSIILTGLILLSLIPVSYGQELTIGQKAQQELVQVEIDLDGNVHAKHVVFPLDSPGSITLIDGTISNIEVKDLEGNEKQFGEATGNNVLLFPSRDKIVVEYDLTDVLVLKDQYWTWNLEYTETVGVIVPHEVDLLYVNGNPISISGDLKGVNCHGCFMDLKYSINEPRIFQLVVWEEQEFLVEIRTVSQINQFSFDQPSKSISFEVMEKGELVTTIIPLELLWEPYTVFQNNEKLAQHDFSNGTHIWLTIEPESSGVVSIIGTTVIPEFPLIAPLVLAFSTIILMPFLGRVIRR